MNTQRIQRKPFKEYDPTMAFSKMAMFDSVACEIAGRQIDLSEDGSWFSHFLGRPCGTGKEMAVVLGSLRQIVDF